MADNDKKPEGSRATKALAGVVQGLNANVGPGVAAAVGMVPIHRAIGNFQKSTPDTLDAFKTESSAQLSNLTSSLVDSTNREKYVSNIPNKHWPPDLNPIALNIEKKPGHIAYAPRSKSVKGGLRDVLDISLKTSPGAIAHEVGHAAALSPASRALQDISLKIRYPLFGSKKGLSRIQPVKSLPSLLALTGAIGNQDENPAYAKAAPYLGGAMLTAILAEEARANLIGIKALERIGYTMPVSKKLKMFLPTLTYLANAIPLIGAPIGVLKGLDYYNKRKAEGRPMTAKELLHASPKTLSTLPSQEDLQTKWRGKLGK